jgi:transposase
MHRRKKRMASNNSKYSEEMRERTVRHIIENGKLATSMAEEKGLKRAEPKTNNELAYRVKELEKELKLKEKQLQEEKNKVEILKKSLHIFMQPQG